MTRIKVAVRVRPLSNREIETGSTSIVAVENHNTIAITNMKVPEQNAGDSRERIRRFTFDYCFQESSTQDHIFEAIENVIGQSIKKRFHSCVLAYGQSSSGKTHTMMGFPHDPGLTPKLCDRVFDYLQETAVGEEVLNLKVSVSYLEIYNEKVRDLLCCEEPDRLNIVKKTQPLRIREHPKKGPYVQGLSEHQVVDSSGLLEWLEKGNKQRRVAATLTNPQSSRSHSVFSISCDGVKLHLIDLAGSERAGNRCYSTSQFREGANINKSLVALGNVISALAEQTSKQAKSIRRKFVPYRDSVLTWLLKDTLGGNSNTVMVATVSPSSACYNETVNTLRFGQRAKLIVSHPVVNEDPKEKTIRELRAEIAKLRDLLKLSQLSPELLSQDSMLARANSFEKNGSPEENQTDNADIVKPSSVLESEELFESIKKENISIRHTEPLNENEINENNPVKINESNKLCGAESTTNNSVPDHILVNNDNLTLTANANVIFDKNSNIATEKLLPLINVSSSIKQAKPTKLRRTFSVDHSYIKIDSGDIKMFSSEESIPSTSTVSQKSNGSIITEKQKPQGVLESIKKPINSSTTSLRRRSLNKSNPSLPKTTLKRKSLENDTNKAEKSVATETLNAKKVESKVDSIRRYNIKPRAQIVAAVTSRLYSKTKKKEVATDTHDINTNKKDLPKELTICTQARTRLKELTRKALRAHKYKDVDTQTDLFPVLRIKEISTDVADLRIMLAEVKDAETESEVIITKDASVDCPGFNNFSDEETRYRSVFFTRTCGTQFPEDHNMKDGPEDTNRNETVLPSTKGPPNTISFTKYLREIQETNFEITDIIPNSPIYTKAVNINISHNYINGNRLNDSASDDSIDNQNMQNVCFPTPDLISNHNSLEQQSHDIPGPSKSEITPNNPSASQIQYADIEILLEYFTIHQSFIPPSNKNVNYTVARCSIVPNYTEKLQSITISNVQAPEVCIVTDFREETCKPFAEFEPELAKPKIVVNKDFKCDDCITLEEPLVLKSIVKQIPKSKPVPVQYLISSDEDISSVDLPDSLDYHMANNKKVKFPGQDSNNPSENQRMVKAMSDFLQEATQLMSTLSVAANSISVGNNLHLDDSYDFEVTLNGISGLKKPSRKRRRKVITKMASTNGDTLPVSKSDCCTQCEIVVPINKYEALVEDSCRRLEEKINRKPTAQPKVHISNNYQDYSEDILDPFSEQLTYNPWDLSHPSNNNDVEDSSLESNPVTFSDYGSLPRKTHKRHRTPTCSPSAFLRQLTNMRKQIIESSREELLGGSNSH